MSTTAITAISAENIKVQNNGPKVAPKVKLTYLPDQFVKSTTAKADPNAAPKTDAAATKTSNAEQATANTKTNATGDAKKTGNIGNFASATEKILQSFRADNRMIEVLKEEYQSIKRENYDSYDEYLKAKDEAYKRWQDAVDKLEQKNNDQKESNAKFLSRAWNSFCNGIQNIAPTLMQILPFLCTLSSGNSQK